MDGATLTELDGTPIVRRPRRPIGVGRTAVLAIFGVAIAVDVALRLLFVLPVWSDFASAGALSMTLTGVVAGSLAFLLPAAFVLRSPDAWQVRRMLLVGALLGAGAELAHSAGAAVSGLAVLQFNAGADTTWRSFMPAADVVNRIGLLAGAVGTLLFAFGLARLRERSAARSSRGVIAVALVVVGLLELWGLCRSCRRQPGPRWRTGRGRSRPCSRQASSPRSTGPGSSSRAGRPARHPVAPGPGPQWRHPSGSRPLPSATCWVSSGRSASTPDSVTALTVVGIGGGLLFVAAVADGLGASAARE